MRFLPAVFLSWAIQASATILENGQVRGDPYPGQASEISIDGGWKSYAPNASEIAYKGRWDSRYISWWSLPGLKFGFTGNKLALSFGENTSPGVLVAYRIAGLDWEFSNVTANATYQFAGSSTTALNGTNAADNKEFELRVQLSSVSVAADARLYKTTEYPKSVEVIGDSLAAGQFATYEGLSSWAFNFAAGLGNVEYSITAYPGICLRDHACYGGGARGMSYQWYRTSDSGDRALATYGDNPEEWDFSARRAADLVIINLGTNDNRDPNNIPGEDFYSDYVKLVDEVHGLWPEAQIVFMSLWGGFTKSGSTYIQKPMYEDEMKRIAEHFSDADYVNFFDTKGILQHNDIAPLDHPTDVGHLKIASHLMQWAKIKLGWEFGATGPEVQHDTLYWNDEEAYK